MTIQIVKPDHTIDSFDHVLEASVNGESGFLNVGYTDPADSRRHDKSYASGQWTSFHFTALTVGGY